jgi:hypothetical protein
MKNLLPFLLILTSFTAFADQCKVYVGNIDTDLNIKQIIQSTGHIYSEKNESDYIISSSNEVVNGTLFNTSILHIKNLDLRDHNLRLIDMEIYHREYCFNESGMCLPSNKEKKTNRKIKRKIIKLLNKRNC